MSKFKNSSEAIDSSLLLYSGVKPTNTSVKEIYDLLVYPVNGIDQSVGSSIIFNLPPQETGLLCDVEIVTKFYVQNGDENLAEQAQVSTVNMIASAMFSLVDVRIDERISLCQQMTNSYNMCHFFETMLMNEPTRQDILYSREMFALDTGTKAESDGHVFYPTANVKNRGGEKRALRIAGSKKVTVMSKLNVPLFKQHKALPPGTRITVTLTKAKNSYCLLCAAGTNFNLKIDDIYLKCTYMKPEDTLLKVMLSKLDTTPVTYEVDKQAIVARMLPQGARTYTITNLFEKELPKFVLFCVQEPEAINGDSTKNPFTFLNIESLQLYINNRQYFPKALTNKPEAEDWRGNSQQLLDNLYKTVMKDHQGAMLVTRENVNLYQFFTVCLTDDRTYDSHYGLKRSSDTRIELDVGAVTNSNIVLIAYCLYDQQIIVNKRNIEIVE